MNYTKGEWKVTRNGVIGYIVSTETSNICQMAKPDLHDIYAVGESEANARLVAAAPEMYEVLKDILQGAIPLSSNAMMEFGKQYIGEFKVYGNRLESAAQALAKAEGREQ